MELKEDGQGVKKKEATLTILPGSMPVAEKPNTTNMLRQRYATVSGV